MAVALTARGRHALAERLRTATDADRPDPTSCWVPTTVEGTPHGSIVFAADGADSGRHREPDAVANALQRRDCLAPPVYYRIGQDVVEIDHDLQRLADSAPAHPRVDAAAALHFAWRGRAPPGQTLYQGIAALTVGEALVFPEAGRPIVRRIDWPLEAGAAETDSTETDADEGDATALVDTVLHRIEQSMLADIAGADASERVGLFLSGGVDSGMLAALATRHARAVTGYTAAFDDAFGLNETPFARRVARSLKIHHRIVRIGIDDAIGHLDALLRSPWPLAAPAAITQAALAAAAAADGQRLVLSGLGADECLGGYHKSLVCLAAQVRQMRLRGLDLPGLYALPGSKLLRAPDLLFHGIAEFFGLAELRRIATMPAALADFARIDLDFYRRVVGIKPTAQPTELMAAHEFCFRIADLLLPALRTPSAGNGCALAFPFLDPKLYRWAASIDPGRHYWFEDDAWWAKRLLRTAAARLLPEDIVMRRRQVLLAPLGHWLLDRRFRRTVLEEIADSPFWRLGALKPEAREPYLRTLRRYRRVETDNRWQEQLWVLLVLCAWVNRHGSASR
jgi:asparagine synthetase B (glutamine-hydrolysing)